VSALDKEIPNLIQSVKQDFDYVVDPHTACAFKDLDPEKKAVILATAHPAKFPAVYQQAGMEIPYSSSLEALKSREPCSYEVPFDSSSVRSFILKKISAK
jgi:threonine synthase